MLGWVALAFVSFVVGSIWAARGRARRQAKPLPAPPPRAADGGLLERTILDLRVHDVVQHDGQDWLIEGVVAYDEDGHGWRGARAGEGAGERWLFVGVDREQPDGVLLLVPVVVAIPGQPPEQLHHDGVAYRQARRGAATVTFTGDPGATLRKGQARCRWWRYQAAGGRLLLVEQWGDEYRTLVGGSLANHDIELLPGS